MGLLWQKFVLQTFSTNLHVDCASPWTKPEKYGRWNPWSSLLWKTPYWLKAEKVTKPFMVELDYCMFGGRRRKHTCLATNCSDLMALNILCDNQREHAPWEFKDGKFSTSEEAAYTPAFCKAVASTVFSALSEKFNFGDAFECNKSLKLSAFPVIARAATKQANPTGSVRVCSHCVHFSLCCRHYPS